MIYNLCDLQILMPAAWRQNGTTETELYYKAVHTDDNNFLIAFMNYFPERGANFNWRACVPYKDPYFLNEKNALKFYKKHWKLNNFL